MKRKGRGIYHKIINKMKNNAILIRIDGTLVAPSDYKVIGSAENWLIFEHVNGVTLSGGILDGQGAGLWSCKKSGKSCPRGATVIKLFRCMHYLTISVSGLKLIKDTIFS